MSYQKDIFEQAQRNGFNAVLSKMLVAQVIHETGNFTSSVWKKNNNCCGYKFVTPNGTKYQLGKGLGSPELNYYGNYAKREDSYQELIDWIKRRQASGFFKQENITVAEYAQQLKSNNGFPFYGDTVANYTAGMQRGYKLLEDEISITLNTSKIVLEKKKQLISVLCTCPHCGDIHNTFEEI